MAMQILIIFGITGRLFLIHKHMWQAKIIEMDKLLVNDRKLNVGDII